MVGQSIVPVYDCLTGQFESFPSSAADIDDPMVCQVHGHLGWNGEDRRLPLFELPGEPARGASRRRQLLPEGRRVVRTRAGPSQPLGTFPTTLRQALKPRAETRTPLKE